MEPASRGGRSRRLLLIALAAAVPWSWFLVRGVGGPVDSVAVGLPFVGVAAIVATAVAAVLTARAWPLVAGASTFVVCAVAVLAPRWPSTIALPSPAYRVVMANLWEENPTPQAVPTSLLERDADMIVAVELPGPPFADEMTASAASAGLVSTVRDGELAAWSRFPLRELADQGLPPARVMRVGVDAPGSPFVMYVVHGLNPLRDTTFSDQRRFVDDLLASIRSEHRPVVVAGDFNMSDRVVSYRMMAGSLTDAMRAGDAGGTTYVGGWWAPLLLRIDHIFVDPGWCAADPGTFTVAGSDHRGIEVGVGPCA
ncbi:MAG: endonuclease/exonuclease/phosphatase family protein [Actinomycetota bacterium]|nr:endonuclease/exonuclease/phosphatase family protein [Actinomycetota bacterium]